MNPGIQIRRQMYHFILPFPIKIQNFVYVLVAPSDTDDDFEDVIMMAIPPTIAAAPPVLAALSPPTIPMFPPQGVVQPGAIAQGGGALPATAALVR